MWDDDGVYACVYVSVANVSANRFNAVNIVQKPIIIGNLEINWIARKLNYIYFEIGIG